MYEHIFMCASYFLFRCDFYGTGVAVVSGVAVAGRKTHICFSLFRRPVAIIYTRPISFLYYQIGPSLLHCMFAAMVLISVQYFCLRSV